MRNAWRSTSGALCITALGCASCGPSVSFVQTGAPRQPLAPTSPVEAYLTRVSRPYHEVGVVEVGSGDLAERVEAARAVARQHGGNGIVFFGTRRVVSTSTMRRMSKLRRLRMVPPKVPLPSCLPASRPLVT